MKKASTEDLRIFLMEVTDEIGSAHPETRDTKISARLLRDILTELLANQEAQQRIAELSAAVIELTTQRDLWYEKTRDLEAVLGRRPAPAATTPISFSENADADMCREWAWKQVKEQLTPDGWTVGDNITYFGFFCWGWDMRRQYNEQRPPAPVVNPEFTGATAVPDFKALAENLVENLVDCGGADEKAVEQFLKWTEKTCRAAMLAQPVNQGYRLNSPVIPDGC